MIQGVAVSKTIKVPVIEDRASSKVDKKEGIQVSERVDTTMTLCIIALAVWNLTRE